MRKVTTLLLLLTGFIVQAQEYGRKDSLRGALTDVRTCYDVHYYDLDLSVIIGDKYIEGTNTIYFTATANFEKMQIDLAENMQVDSVVFEGESLVFTRDFDAVFIQIPRVIKENEQAKLKVAYSGNPRKAVNAPWDGGFSWKKDDNDKPWIGVSCQGLGASVWWPCKDHQSDEPDSMRIACSIPEDLEVVSNGDLRSRTTFWSDRFQKKMSFFEWFVTYPINNYNVTLNIGDYVRFSDIYISEEDSLAMDYYVLSYNEEKARKHFEQVKPMLSCFENYFGKYPFWNDGYALVETPYLGMEHQSAIAYGNDYLKGYHGNTNFIDGLEFDFIIVHESGHEWWGNSITTNDIADMWVHEGFCTYSEVLYVECLYGYDAMLGYVNNQKRNVRNDKAIIGHYHVNAEGSGDMYNKGSLMLHTLRTLLEDDVLWFEIIRGVADDFKHQTVDGQDIIAYINKKTGKDFADFFDQYLGNAAIPEFQYSLEKQGKNITLVYKWNATPNFDMPILINTGREDFWIYPNNEWKEQDLGAFDRHDFRVRDDLFFIDIKKM